MRKLRAVLIDDQEIVVNVLRDYLLTRNYEVLSYTNPAACPIHDVKGNYGCMDNPCADVIITDFKMPGMNGLELLREQSAYGCKLTKENKAVMSGYIDEESHEQIQHLGHAFFQKPIAFSRLAAWLDDCEKRVDLSRPLSSRRKETRHSHSYNVRCLIDRTSDILKGTTVNISDGGLCIALAVPLMTRQTVHIDGAQSLVGCRTAYVQWVSQNQDGLYLAGLSCLN
jgi:CheY-like chemotaxis protein